MYLVINPGSTSLKYTVFDEDETRLLSHNIIDQGHHVDFPSLETDVNEKVGHGNIHTIIVRVVHGGPHFSQPVRVDQEVLKQIQDVEHLAPLHNPSATSFIASILAHTSTPVWVVFDTGFHASIPEKAYIYALPKDLVDTHSIRKYGFHGSSHQYLSRTLADLDPSARRVITLHLGGGVSMAAISDGICMDTSMGMTPTAGLVMATRTGDIDPSIVTYLMTHVGLDAHQIDIMLNYESGLLGVSGYSDDMRRLVQDAQNHIPNAQSALDVFLYSIVKYIGSYHAVLRGVDALVFSGGIGEHSAFIRDHICQQVSFLGVEIDQNINEAMDGSKPVKFSATHSSLSVWMIPTDEEVQMLREVKKRENR